MLRCVPAACKCTGGAVARQPCPRWLSAVAATERPARSLAPRAARASEAAAGGASSAVPPALLAASPPGSRRVQAAGRKLSRSCSPECGVAKPWATRRGMRGQRVGGRVGYVGIAQRHLSYAVESAVARPAKARGFAHGSRSSPGRQGSRRSMRVRVLHHQHVHAALQPRPQHPVHRPGHAHANSPNRHDVSNAAPRPPLPVPSALSPTSPSINASSTTNSTVSSHVPAVPGPRLIGHAPSVRAARSPNQPTHPQIAAACHVRRAKTTVYTRNAPHSRSLSRRRRRRRRRPRARRQLCIDMLSTRELVKPCAHLSVSHAAGPTNAVRVRRVPPSLRLPRPVTPIIRSFCGAITSLSDPPPSKPPPLSASLSASVP
jgi:hypothetical protein